MIDRNCICSKEFLMDFNFYQVGLEEVVREVVLYFSYLQQYRGLCTVFSELDIYFGMFWDSY